MTVWLCTLILCFNIIIHHNMTFSINQNRSFNSEGKTVRNIEVVKLHASIKFTYLCITYVLLQNLVQMLHYQYVK